MQPEGPSTRSASATRSSPTSMTFRDAKTANPGNTSPQDGMSPNDMTSIAELVATDNNSATPPELNSCDKVDPSVTAVVSTTSAAEASSLSTASSSSTLADKGAPSSPSSAETQKSQETNPAPADSADAVTKDSESNGETSEKKEDSQDKKKTGWRNTAPFSVKNKTLIASSKNCISWYELTLREKYEYRKRFLREYFSETKACLPYVKRLFHIIYRISPWRGAVLLLLNAVNAFLPALALRAQGDFLILVS